MSDYSTSDVVFHAGAENSWLTRVTGIVADSLPFNLPKFSIQTRISGPAGEVEVVCEIVRPNGGISMIDLVATVRIAPPESPVVWPFRNLELPMAGVYVVRIWAKNTLIREAELPVTLRSALTP